MKIIQKLQTEFQSLHTLTRKELAKTTAGVMITSAILSVIVFGISSGMTAFIGFVMK